MDSKTIVISCLVSLAATIVSWLLKRWMAATRRRDEMDRREFAAAAYGVAADVVGEKIAELERGGKGPPRPFFNDVNIKIVADGAKANAAMEELSDKLRRTAIEMARTSGVSVEQAARSLETLSRINLQPDRSAAWYGAQLYRTDDDGKLQPVPLQLDPPKSLPEPKRRISLHDDV